MFVTHGRNTACGRIRIWLYNARVLKTADVEVERAPQKRGSGLAAWITRRYTRQGLWSLFLMCAFPLHAWTLILAFRDISWLTERTNAWDAVGVTSYGLVFAFMESLILFGVMVLLGYAVSGKWDPERRVALLALLALLASLWAIVGQLYFLIGTGLPGWLIGLLIWTRHPLRAMQAGALGLVSLTVLVPVMLVLRSKRVFDFMRGLIDRLSVLTMFYLVLDVIGLVIVIVRNI